MRKIFRPKTFSCAFGVAMALGCVPTDKKSNAAQVTDSLASCTVTYQTKDVSCTEYTLGDDAVGNALKSELSKICSGQAGSDGFAYAWSATSGCSELARTFKKCAIPASADKAASTIYGSTDEEECKKEGGTFTTGQEPQVDYAPKTPVTSSLASCSVTHQNKDVTCTEYTLTDDPVGTALKAELAKMCSGQAGAEGYAYGWSATSGCSEMAKVYDKCDIPDSGDRGARIVYGAVDEEPCKQDGGTFTVGKKPEI